MGIIYRKKPLEIEAVKWTGDNLKEIREFVTAGIDESSGLQIKTTEGWMSVKEGDYIIKGIEGEFYPCKESVFNNSYIKVYNL